MTPDDLGEMEAEAMIALDDLVRAARNVGAGLNRPAHDGRMREMAECRDRCDQAILALAAAARRGVADTRDAERYRFLRDNPLQLRAIDGNSAWCGQWSAKQFDEHTDASRALPPEAPRS